MPLLLYAPEVQLVIQAESGTYDVSSDITRGGCTLVENGVNSMHMSLLNRGRKYDRLFKPNDIFVLYLKRLQKLLVMTGYLDTVPFFSVWPRTIQITGSSTLKSMQYRFWEPGNVDSYNLLKSDNYSNVGTTSYNDDGLAMKATKLATEVGGWNPNNIHFGSLPTTWIKQTTTLYDTISPVLAAQATASLGSAVQGGQTSPLQSGVTTSASLPPGAPEGAEWPVGLPEAVGYKSASPSNTFGSTSGSYYCQMEWTYQLPDGTTPVGVSPGEAKAQLAKQKLMVVNPDKNSAVVVQPVSWGPSGSDGLKQIGLSNDALVAIGISDSGAAQVVWVTDPKVPLGPYTASAASNVGGATSSPIPPQVRSPSGQSGSAAAASGQPAQASGGQTAANAAIAQVGTPYVWGGGSDSGATAGSGGDPGGNPVTGQSGFDCSGLCMFAWAQGGAQLPHYTVTQQEALTAIPGPSTNWLPGDLLFYNDGSGGAQPGHVKMYIGNNQTVEAPYTGANVYITSCGSDGSASSLTFMGCGRVTPAYAAANPPGSKSPTNYTSPSSSGAGSNGTPSASGSIIGVGDNFGVAPDSLSVALTGFRAMLVDTPFLPMFQTICNGSMRSFCNAPNGDIIAWFPDYFNQYNCLGILDIEDIELQDFTIMWSDTSMVTHQFVAGTTSNVGTLSAGSIGGTVAFNNIVTTDGVATIDFPQILQTLFNISNDDDTFSSQAIYRRFGARVNYQGIGTIVSSLAEFWYALYLFQQNWASMFSASVPIAFMPEAYPGMILRIKSVGFQCYIEEVTHEWDLNDGGGYSTSVNVVAPSSTTDTGLWGFAQAGPH